MSIDSSFITRRKSVHTPLEENNEYSDIIKAASQINGLGKNIILAGSRNSGKSTFAKNFTDRNSTIARTLLDFRISSAKGAQLPDVCFQATDDERIPREALVIVLSAAKPLRSLLDDSNRFFCRIAYDLARFCTIQSIEIRKIERETLTKSIAKSVENYISANGDNALAEWLNANDETLFIALIDELSRTIADGTFATASIMLFRQSETERTFRLNNSGMSFELFCKYCQNNNIMQEGFDRFWNALIPSIQNSFTNFCREIANAEGCFFTENEEGTVQLTLVSDFRDEAKCFFAAHQTAQHIFSKLFYSKATNNGNRLVPENYFSNVRYVFRMDGEIIKCLTKKGMMNRLAVMKSDERTVHAINLIEVGKNHAEDLESTIKLYSAAGMIVFGANDEFSSRSELFDNVSRVLRESVTRFPITLIRTKREQDALCALTDESTKPAKISAIVNSEDNFHTDAQLAGKRELESYHYRIINEYKRNRNKVHPIICGAFSAAHFPKADGEFADKVLDIFNKAKICDADSAEYIANVLISIFDETSSKIISVNSTALAANYAEFANDCITITPNVFSTLCSAYSANASDCNGEQAVLSSWLVFGEKFDDEHIGSVPEATFVNSLRSVYRTYLKKHIIASPNVAANVTDSPDALMKLIDGTLQSDFGGAFARIVGEYCFKKIGSENISPENRFRSMISVISNELFPADEVTITRDNTLGKLISLALNDCIHTAIRRNCCIEH